MAQDGSESLADVREALVAAGLGSVATAGTIDVLARDHAAWRRRVWIRVTKFNWLLACRQCLLVERF